MPQIAFILLCHKNPAGVVQQANSLTELGDKIAIHVDKNAPDAVWNGIRDGLKDNPNVVFADRLRCGWGEWSLIAATLNALSAAEEAFPEATHFYMLSGDCMPIKSRAYMDRFLATHDCDFVEHNDFFESDWIKVGIKEERLIYRHFFNERARKKWFYLSLDIQKRLKLAREIPKDLNIYIGSQWWVMRRATAEKVLRFVEDRKDVVRFFSTTWIPDETFFQTIVMHLIPRDEVQNRTLTHLAFSDYGMPVVFYNDHHDLLISQEYLFARKVSEDALELRSKLKDQFLHGPSDVAVANTSKPLFEYLTSRGRIGRRFSRRFWDRGGQIGRGHEVLAIACKKWHVGQRFIDRARTVNAPVALGYVFDEEGNIFHDLGNIESSREKRGRHRRAFLKLLFELHDTERLLICLDPSNIDTIRDLHHDECGLRILEIKCDIDDDYLLGHAQRISLLQEDTKPDIARPLLHSLRREFKDESENLRDLHLAHFYSIEERQDAALNTEQVARFLGVPSVQAEQIVGASDLFD